MMAYRNPNDRQDDWLERRLDRVEALLWRILGKEFTLMSKMDDLEAQVEAGTTVSASLRVLFDKVLQAAKDAGVTDARLDAVIGKLKGDADADSERVLANTPQEPPVDPNPTPA